MVSNVTMARDFLFFSIPGTLLPDATSSSVVARVVFLKAEESGKELADLISLVAPGLFVTDIQCKLSWLMRHMADCFLHLAIRRTTFGTERFGGSRESGGVHPRCIF